MAEPCTCPVGADECDGQFGTFLPLGNGGSCAVRPCQKPAAPLSISRKAVIKKCCGGRTEHLMEPEWEGRSYAFMKCRWCGKREAV